jgi:hypothetical protein
MRSAMTRERAALAVIEQALSKVLPQLALAQSTARLCGKLLSDELEGLVAHATELRQRSRMQSVSWRLRLPIRSTKPSCTGRDAATSTLSGRLPIRPFFSITDAAICLPVRNPGPEHHVLGHRDSEAIARPDLQRRLDAGIAPGKLLAELPELLPEPAAIDCCALRLPDEAVSPPCEICTPALITDSIKAEENISQKCVFTQSCRPANPL